MTHDIKVLKSLGFNMLRKHVKIESPLYYAAADELGILIIQDMPSLAATTLPNRAQYEEFRRQVEVWIDQFKSYSSIISWVSQLVQFSSNARLHLGYRTGVEWSLQTRPCEA
jgi:beta-galactosidase/beta-glucuronidase